MKRLIFSLLAVLSAMTAFGQGIPYILNKGGRGTNAVFRGSNYVDSVVSTNVATTNLSASQINMVGTGTPTISGTSGVQFAVPSVNATGTVSAANVQSSLTGSTNVPGIVSVTDFGASTNAADNSAAFQAAINSLPNGDGYTTDVGGMVEVDSGIWYVNSSIYLKPGIAFQGKGQETSFIVLQNNAQIIGNADAWSNVVWHSYALRHLAIKTTNAVPALVIMGTNGVRPYLEDLKLFGAGIIVSNATKGTIEDITIQTPTGDGLDLLGVNNSMVLSGVHVSDATGIGVYGKVIGTTFDSVSADQNALGGFSLTNSRDVVLTACSAEKNGDFNFKAGTCVNVTVNGFYSLSDISGLLIPTNGFYLDAATSINLENVDFAGSCVTNGYAVFTTNLPSPSRLIGGNFGSWGTRSYNRWQDFAFDAHAFIGDGRQLTNTTVRSIPILEQTFTGSALPSGWTASTGWGVATNTLYSPASVGWGKAAYWDVTSQQDQTATEATIKLGSGTSIAGVVRRDNYLTWGSVGLVDAASKSITVWGGWNGTAEPTLYASNYVAWINANNPLLVKLTIPETFWARLEVTDTVTGSNAVLNAQGTLLFGRDAPGVVCVAGSCAVSQLRYYSYATASPKWLLFGDSYTQGSYLTTNTIGTRYSALLREYLHGDCIIAGRGGEATTEALTRMPWDVEKAAARYVLVLNQNDTDYATFAANMTNIIARIQARGAVAIVGTPAPACSGGYWDTVPKRTEIAEATAWVLTNSAALNYRVVDFNYVLSGGARDYMLPNYAGSDLIHPSTAGNQAMFQRCLVDLGDILMQPNQGAASYASLGVGTTAPTNGAPFKAVGGGGATWDMAASVRAYATVVDGLWFGYSTQYNVGLIGAVSEGTAQRDINLVNDGGNVGIKTMTPTAYLDVNGSAVVRGVFSASNIVTFTSRVGIGGASGNDGTASLHVRNKSGSDQNDAIVKFWADSTNNVWIAYDRANSVGLIGAITEGVSHNKLALSPFGGNVGIGTNNPQTALHVVGTNGLRVDSGNRSWWDDQNGIGQTNTASLTGRYISGGIETEYYNNTATRTFNSTNGNTTISGTMTAAGLISTNVAVYSSGQPALTSYGGWRSTNAATGSSLTYSNGVLDFTNAATSSTNLAIRSAVEIGSGAAAGTVYFTNGSATFGGAATFSAGDVKAQSGSFWTGGASTTALYMFGSRYWLNRSGNGGFGLTGNGILSVGRDGSPTGSSDGTLAISNITASGTITATNGFYTTAPTNGVAPPSLVYQPIGLFGFMGMSGSTNTVTVGSSGTYYVVTNFNSFRTNNFVVSTGASTGGYLTNLYAGFYRISYYLSCVSGNSDTLEVEVNVNGTGKEEISGFATYDNPARMRVISGGGILYLPANSYVSLQVNNRSSASNVTIWRGGLTIGTP